MDVALETKPKPYRKRGTILQGRDERIGQHLNYHGPLAVPYLAALLEQEFQGTNIGNLKVRLHTLLNRGEPWLITPGRELFGYPRTTYFVYSNAATMDDHLLNLDLIDHPTLTLKENNYRHELLLAHVTASLRLGAWKNDVEFVCEPEVIKGHPRQLPCEITHKVKIWDDSNAAFRSELRASHKALNPDHLFQINDDGKYITYFVEADRATEQVDTSDLDKKAWLPTLLKYLAIFDPQSPQNYRKHFGIKSPARLLIVSTKRSKINDIKATLLRITNKQGHPDILFKLWHEFNEKRFIPSEVNYQIYEGPWERAGTDLDTGLDYQPVLFSCDTIIVDVTKGGPRVSRLQSNRCTAYN